MFAVRMWVAAAVLATTVVIAGGAGWFINGWRLAAAHAKTERAARDAFDARLKTELEDRAVRVAQLEAQNTALAEDIATMRSWYSERATEITSANLIPAQSDETCELRNPFGDDFVRLWNGAARSLSF